MIQNSYSEFNFDHAVVIMPFKIFVRNYYGI